MHPVVLRQRRAERIRRVLARSAVVVIALGLGLVITAQRGLRTPEPSRLLVDRRGTYLGEVPAGNDELGYWPLPAQLPERIVAATLIAEDRGFYDHIGVHAPSVARAVVQNVTSGRVVSGASTLAMQVARMQGGRARSFGNKAREAVEALHLVRDHGHEAVLRQYLTLAPYGHRVHGAERAARMYFDRPLADLTWLQAAFLAGLPQQPGRFSPWTDAGRRLALHRAHRILRSLYAFGGLDDEQLKIALHQELGLVPRPAREPDALHAILAFSETARTRPAGRLETTLDLDLQRRAAELVRQHVARLGGAGAGNGAALVVDLATGDVLAWVGSTSFFDTEAHGPIDYVQVRRSPGSTLKPFIYGLAIDRIGWTAATMVPDTPAEFPSPTGGTFLPENASDGFLGPMLVRQALANSRNIPALRALREVGPQTLVELLVQAGMRLPDDAAARSGLALALGAEPLSLEELATSYLVLAGNGRARTLRRFAGNPDTPGPRLLREETVKLLRHVLADPEARRPVFAEGGPLDFPYAVAVKTGTSEGIRDAWTVAWSDRVLVATWVGNHDWRQMSGVSGATAAGPLAHDLMDLAMQTREPHRPPPLTFAPPAGWEAREVCGVSGLLAGPYCTHRHLEHFQPGTDPAESCDVHHLVSIDRRNGLRATATCPREHVRTEPMLDLPANLASFLRRQRVDVAPTAVSPLCPGALGDARVTIVEPLPKARFRWDPDTPPESASIRFAAEATPADEPVVWLVDDRVVARTEHPNETRWSLEPGRHVIRAAFARLGVVSDPVEIVVER